MDDYWKNIVQQVKDRVSDQRTGVINPLGEDIANGQMSTNKISSYLLPHKIQIAIGIVIILILLLVYLFIVTFARPASP